MKFSRRCTWQGAGRNLIHDGTEAMETLATFPTVRIGGPPTSTGNSASCAAPAAVPTSAPEPCSEAPRTRRTPMRVPSRSVTILAIVALATWAAVWWIERGRSGAPGAAVMAQADALDGEAVVR